MNAPPLHEAPRTIGIELEFANVRPIDLQPHLPPGWETIGDSSIRNTDGTWSRYGKMDVSGAEVRTILPHPLSWYSEERLSLVLSAVGEQDGKPNRYCGLHVHVGTFSRDRDMMLRVAGYFRRNSIAELAGTIPRRIRKQCAPIDRNLLAALARRDLEDLRLLCDARADGRNNPFREREVNGLSLLKYGTIEFRVFASTLHAREIIAAIRWSLELTDACLQDGPLPVPEGPLPQPIHER
ncbi:MAG: hypothetical protein Kow0089_03460 [Desulfobulbaceae bacterium]